MSPQNHSFLHQIVEASRVSTDDRTLPWDLRKLLPYCTDLGLIDSDHRRFSHAWNIDCAPIDSLTSLPTKLQHAGRYDWIGEKDERHPAWLWDSRDDKTVPATQAALNQGYVAVTYTWGRWRSKDRTDSSPATPWPVPLVDSNRCSFSLSRLKTILKRIPSSRYFWVDVLCINQSDDEETRTEISKQAAIFARAKGVVSYLWTLESANDLIDAVQELGDIVLWSVRLSGPQDREQSTFRGSSRPRPPGTKFQRDHWFTSLWTLQEMILSPGSLFLTAKGDYCSVNGKFVTVAFIAAACHLCDELRIWRLKTLKDESEMRQRFLEPRFSTERAEAIGRAESLGRDTRWLDQRNEEEMSLQWQLVSWRFWAQTYIIPCLSASRSQLLVAASRREATSRRGEAVMAAMKVAPFEGVFVNDTVPALGGLPSALITKLLQVEGRVLLQAAHKPRHGSGGPLDTFFTDILPTTAEKISHVWQDSSMTSVEAKDWYVSNDGLLHISAGSVMQTLSSTSRQQVFINIGGTAEAAVQCKEFEAEGHAQREYRKWRHDGTAFRQERFPENVQTLFLPLHRKTVVEPSDIISVGGVILMGGPQRWYKCGGYFTKSYSTYRLPTDIVVAPAEQ